MAKYPDIPKSDWGIINYDDFMLAARNWDNLLGIQRIDHHASFNDALCRFLNFNIRDKAEWFEGDVSSKKVILPRHCIPKMKMLASPHHVALYKAWLIKNAPLRI